MSKCCSIVYIHILQFQPFIRPKCAAWVRNTCGRRTNSPTQSQTYTQWNIIGEYNKLIKTKFPSGHRGNKTENQHIQTLLYYSQTSKKKLFSSFCVPNRIHAPTSYTQHQPHKGRYIYSIADIYVYGFEWIPNFLFRVFELVFLYERPGWLLLLSSCFAKIFFLYLKALT